MEKFKNVLLTCENMDMLLEFEAKDNGLIFKHIYKKPLNLNAVMGSYKLENYDDEEKYKKMVYDYLKYESGKYRPDPVFYSDINGKWYPVKDDLGIPIICLKDIIKVYKPELTKKIIIDIMSDLRMSIEPGWYGPELAKCLNICNKNDYDIDELLELLHIALIHKDEFYFN